MDEKSKNEKIEMAYMIQNLNKEESHTLLYNFIIFSGLRRNEIINKISDMD